MNSKYKVGLIHGFGIQNLDMIKNRIERPVTTIFGDPSDVLVECTIEGMECALMCRKGKENQHPPNMVNYRANVWALKEAGCTHVISGSLGGSLKEDLKPGEFIMPDNFLDFTSNRKHSFFDGESGSPPGTVMCPMNPPFCEPLRKFLADAAGESEFKCVDGGVGVTITGPRFPTKSESKMYQTLGGDFVNMTLCSEAILCKEAGMLCAPLVFITDYDSWRDGARVNQRIIRKMKKANFDSIEKLTALFIRKIGTRDWDKEIEDLKKEIGQGLGKCGCKK